MCQTEYGAVDLFVCTISSVSLCLSASLSLALKMSDSPSDSVSIDNLIQSPRISLNIVQDIILWSIIHQKSVSSHRILSRRCQYSCITEEDVRYISELHRVTRRQTVRQKQTQRHRDTETYTDRHNDRQTGRQTDRKADRYLLLSCFNSGEG